jgi:hypothetical protein
MIPDSLPVISSGSHQNPSEGACVMEYVSMLAGEAFSDFPKCTHRALARVAQLANDALPDARRHEMVYRINRLFGTNSAKGEEAFRISVGLAKFSATRAADADAFAAAFAYDAAAQAAYAARAAHAAHAAAYAATAASAAYYAVVGAAAPTQNTQAEAMLQFLDDIIDEYDRLAGRTSVEDVVCKLPAIAVKVGV